MTMIDTDVIIVGGGPAGAACAWELNRYGIDCRILERTDFPRTKLCAGWITPEVVADLALDIEDYPHRFMTFEKIQVHWRNWRFKLKSRQHSIRRYEFDHWLIERSQVPVDRHYVRSIEYRDGWYHLDDKYRCRYLVGAAGTKCPVYRNLFREANPRARELQAVTLEQEFAYDWHDPDCHLWFFDHGLPGYSWYVPKADGYINVGIGGMASKLKQSDDDIKRHWVLFCEDLQRRNLVCDFDYSPSGYSYYLRGGVETIRIDNAFIVGDAVGLATRDLCEGIGPAVRTGIASARAIDDASQPYTLQSVRRFSLDRGWAPRALEYMIVKRRAKPAKSAAGCKEAA